MSFVAFLKKLDKSVGFQQFPDLLEFTWFCWFPSNWQVFEVYPYIINVKTCFTIVEVYV